MATKRPGDETEKASSADEIIDQLAEEMGVDPDDDASEDEETAEDETEAADDSDEEAADGSDDDGSDDDDADDHAADDDDGDEQGSDDDSDDAADDDEVDDDAAAAAAASDDDEEAVEEAAADEPEPAPKKGKAKKGKKSKGKASTEKKPAAAAPAAAAAVAAEPPEQTNEEAIQSVFSGRGEETPLGDPHASEYYDPDLDDPSVGKRSPLPFIITLAVILIGVGAAYFAVPDHIRSDIGALMQGRDIQQIKIDRHREEEERRHQEFLANAPKFGTFAIVTQPQALLVTAEGHPTMIVQGTGSAVPTRTRVSFENVKVDEPFTFTIHGEGVIADREVTIPPFNEIGSPWVQSYGGDYTATLTYVLCFPDSPNAGADHCLSPAEGVARELEWRLNWRPPLEAPEDVPTALTGTITVTSNPEGARIVYNNRILLDPETGDYLTTPLTFDTYYGPTTGELRQLSEYNQAIAQYVQAETPVEEWPEELREPPVEIPEARPVELKTEGLPLQLLPPDGSDKIPAITGIYKHLFTCEPIEGQEPPPEPDPDADPAEEPPMQAWWEYCNYTYSVHLDLQDPPAEGSGEEAADGEEAGEEAPEGEAAEGEEEEG